MCALDKPDCFNCPYSDCTASMDDIRRHWKNGYKETTDQFLREALYDYEKTGGRKVIEENGKRYCDCCGVKLTKRNNKCGFEICDKCNDRLEKYMKEKQDGQH